MGLRPTNRLENASSRWNSRLRNRRFDPIAETSEFPDHSCGPALNTLVGDHKKVFEASYAQVHEAIRRLVKRGVKSGDIRKDLDPSDLLRALVGVANVASTGAMIWSRKIDPRNRVVQIQLIGRGTRCV
jgi:hypothetical protein